MSRAILMSSRELRRVPMDFDCPIGKTWEGYLRDDAIEPPSGEGFQAWQTVSEGGPISPVFTTLDDLTAWLSENAGPPGWRIEEHRWTPDEWAQALGGVTGVDIHTGKIVNPATPERTDTHAE